MLALGRVPFEKLDGGVAVYRTGNIPLLSVYLCREYIGCETGTDTFSHPERSYSLLELSDAAVRESYVDHILFIIKLIQTNLQRHPSGNLQNPRKDSNF